LALRTPSWENIINQSNLKPRQSVQNCFFFLLVFNQHKMSRTNIGQWDKGWAMFSILVVAIHFLYFVAKRPNLNLDAWTKQFLHTLLLVILSDKTVKSKFSLWLSVSNFVCHKKEEIISHFILLRYQSKFLRPLWFSISYLHSSTCLSPYNITIN
jgi:hypothetical protein